jgi:Tol biopolymer transport system component
MRFSWFTLACLAGAVVLGGCGPRQEENGLSSGTTKQEYRNTQLQFSGRIVFQSNADGDNEIYLLTRDGVRRLTDNTCDDEYPVWSPDGLWIAFSSNRSGSFGIYVMDAEGGEVRAVTESDEDDGEPSWFPDGEHLAFSRETKKLLRRSTALHRVNISSGDISRILPDYRRAHGIPHVSPTGSGFTFTGKRTMGWDVAVFDPVLQQVKFLDEGGKSCRARFSRDGRRLAYVSSKADGKGDIWQMFPDGSQKTRLTLRDSTYDYFPAWSPDGRFIVFNSSPQHDHDGDWQLWLYDTEEKTAVLLYDSPGSDVFPDWN